MKKLLSRIVLLVIVCLVIFSHFPREVVASETDHKKLLTNVYTFLQYVEEGRYQSADVLLGKIERMTKTQHIGRSIVFTNEVLDPLFEEVHSVLLDDQSTDKEKFQVSLSMVLAFDALLNEEDPLWQEWTSYLANEIDKTLQTGTSNTNSVQDLYGIYVHLLPAFRVSLDENMLKTMDTNQEMFFTNMDQRNMNEVHEVLVTLSKDLRQLKEKDGKETNKSLTEEPAFIWLLWSVGGLIVVTLFYVAWRKYKGERDKTTKYKEPSS